MTRQEAEQEVAVYFYFINKSDGRWHDLRGELICESHPYWDAWNLAIDMYLKLNEEDVYDGNCGETGLRVFDGGTEREDSEFDGSIGC